jgi:hypothetical protein
MTPSNHNSESCNELRPISGLREYLEPAAQCHEVETVELGELLASMERQGQLVPIEITPEGTILDGKLRVRLAAQLGWDEIQVCVRLDLADGAGPRGGQDDRPVDPK